MNPKTFGLPRSNPKHAVVPKALSQPTLRCCLRRLSAANPRMSKHHAPNGNKARK